MNEGGSNHIDVVFGTEDTDVVDIFLTEDGELNLGAGQVHVFALAYLAVVEYFDNHRFLFDFGHLASERAIRNEDSAANFDRLGQGRVCAGDLGVVTLEVVVSANF